MLIFGFFHGFGLSTKLQDLAISEDGLIANMLSFNVGVELGQLIFVVLALGATALLRRVPLRRHAWLPYAAPYAIGSLAMFWVIERIGAFFG